MLKKLFCEHPQSVDETYFEHFSMAAGFGTKMILGGLACWLHAIFPFMYKKTGSKAVISLHESMKNRGNAPAQEKVIHKAV